MTGIIKGIGKILFTIIIVLYLLLEIFLAVCLLNYNDYRITVFGNKSLLLLTEDLDDKYKKNDLVIVTKGDGSEVKEGDSIFFYNPGQNYTVNYAEVTSISPHANKTYTYKIGTTHNVYTEYYIGKDTKVYKGLAGPMRLLESKWGFLLLIVLPTMIAVIYEFYAIIVEIIEFKKEVDNE